MKRVTREGGWVGATVWDLAGSRAPMAPLWTAFAEVAPQQPDERDFQGGSRESLRSILEGAALRDVEVSELSVTVTHPTFEEWWQPYLHGVGPAGEVVAALDPDRRREVEQIAAPQPRRRTVRHHRRGVGGPRAGLSPGLAAWPGHDVSHPSGDGRRLRRTGLLLARHDAQPSPPSPPQRGLSSRPPRCGVWRAPVAPPRTHRGTHDQPEQHRQPAGHEPDAVRPLHAVRARRHARPHLADAGRSRRRRAGSPPTCATATRR